LAGGGGNYFSTLDSKRHATNNTQVRELQRKVSTLESETEKMKKEHLLQLKRKDEFIRDLINRKDPNNNSEETSTGDRRIVTRVSVRKVQRDASAVGELKSPSHRFTPPTPTAESTERKVICCVLRSRVMYIVYKMSHIYFVGDAIYNWATVEAYQDFTQRLLVPIEDSSSILSLK
jgi:hypothetical protein